jgi:hypothetical protein
VFGLILAFAVQHAIDAGLVVCVAIMLGHAWALQHTTDVTTSFWSALEGTVPELRRYHLLLIALILGSWATVSFVARRYLRMKRRAVDAT